MAGFEGTPTCPVAIRKPASTSAGSCATSHSPPPSAAAASGSKCRVSGPTAVSRSSMQRAAKTRVRSRGAAWIPSPAAVAAAAADDGAAVSGAAGAAGAAPPKLPSSSSASSWLPRAPASAAAPAQQGCQHIHQATCHNWTSRHSLASSGPSVSCLTCGPALRAPCACWRRASARMWLRTDSVDVLYRL